MKSKLFFAILCMLVATSSFAAVKKELNAKSFKSVSVNGFFDKIYIGKNLNVVLVDDPGSAVTIEGDAKFINNVKIENLNGTLTITTTGKTSFQNGKIYVPVKNLSKVDLMPDSKVVSDGVLNCKKLEVSISDGSIAELKNKGQLKISANGNIELEFQKDFRIKE